MKNYITISLLGFLMVATSCTRRVFVTEKPPEIVTNRPNPPGPEYVWIGPGYVKQGNTYVQRPGYWITPPNNRHRWIEGRWKAKRGGWVWIPGHWN